MGQRGWDSSLGIDMKVNTLGVKLIVLLTFRKWKFSHLALRILGFLEKSKSERLGHSSCLESAGRS